MLRTHILNNIFEYVPSRFVNLTQRAPTDFMRSGCRKILRKADLDDSPSISAKAEN